MKQTETTSKDYSTSVQVKASPEAAFSALTKEISEWWGDMDSPVNGPDDIFTVSWGEPWYRFRVSSYEPDSKISWECIDANQIIGDLEGVQKEWVGSRLDWTIKELGNEEIVISLVHHGLVPEQICYSVCSNAWDRFVGFSLKKFLEGEI